MNPTLGVSLGLTGPEAYYAAQLRAAVDLALDDSLQAVTLRVEDDHADDGPIAIEAARRLAADPDVLAVVGPMNSWTCFAQGPVYSAAGLAFITPSGSNPALAEQGWRGFVRACADDVRQGEALARIAVRRVGAARVAALHDGSSFAAPLCDVFASVAARHGAACDAPRDGRQSVDSAAVHVAGYAPDAVLVAGLEDFCRAAALSLRRAGFRKALLGTDALKPTHALRVDGYPAPWLTSASADARVVAPAHDARLRARLGRHDTIYTVETYDAVRWVLSATGGGARTRDAVRAALAEGHRGLAGDYVIDHRGERLDASIGVYRDEPEGIVSLGSTAALLGC